MEFVELAYKRIVTGWIETYDYVDWANELLEGGSDAPSIAELASFCWDASLDPQQVERLFQSCVLELGLTLPRNWDEALLTYTSSLCQNVLSGTLTPWDCMEQMLTLSDDNNEPYILWIWIDLVRDMAPAHVRDQGDVLFNSALDLKNSDECIRKTAQQFVDLSSIALATKFPLVWWCQECGEISDENTFVEMNTCACKKCGAISGKKNMRFFEHRNALLKKNATTPAALGV